MKWLLVFRIDGDAAGVGSTGHRPRIPAAAAAEGRGKPAGGGTAYR